LKTLPAVILDANVLVQAPIRDTLLRLAEGPTLYRTCWTEEIMAEVKRTLEGKFGITRSRTGHLEAKLREHFPEAWIEGFEHLLPQMANHPKDRHVLAAAAHSKARTIVTYNLRDFPPEATEPWRVTAVGPSTFLKRLYRTDEALVIETIREQAADIQRSFEEQLKVLHLAVPGFVELVCHDTGLKI